MQKAKAFLATVHLKVRQEEVGEQITRGARMKVMTLFIEAGLDIKLLTTTDDVKYQNRIIFYVF